MTTLNESGLARSQMTWYTNESNVPTGPIVITMVPSGGKTYPTLTTDAAPLGITRQTVNLNDYFAGNSRVVGGGFEVHNVTNKLNVKGTATVYRLPQTYTNSSLAYRDWATIADVSFNLIVPDRQFSIHHRLPPATANDAMILPFSKQWNAEYGSYQVLTMDHDQPNTTQFGIRHYGFYDFAGGQDANVAGDGVSLLPGLTTGASDTIVKGAVAASGGVTATTPVSTAFKVMPADTTGVFYTGLGDDTVLTLTAIFIIETFPSNPSPLVTLARPPPQYDPLFFALYKEIALALPPGVMVSENASGDWWEKVIDTVSDVASAFVPGAKMMGTGIKAAVNLGKSAYDKNKQNAAAKGSQKPAPKGAKASRPAGQKEAAIKSALNKGKSTNHPYVEKAPEAK